MPLSNTKKYYLGERQRFIHNGKSISATSQTPLTPKQLPVLKEWDIIYNQSSVVWSPCEGLLKLTGRPKYVVAEIES